MNSAPDAAFFALATVLTLAGVWRELPLQYVLTVASILYGISALGYWVLKESSWWLPLIVLNSRGVSRYVLYKWRDRPYYGWWVLGLTCVLSFFLAWTWHSLALAFLMQIAALPWLIKRRPGFDRPNSLPAIIWLGLAGWMVIRQILIFNPGIAL
jgi:lysylphosphatidylglycerol synthetase-like protein (DUF2156 family)